MGADPMADKIREFMRTGNYGMLDPNLPNKPTRSGGGPNTNYVTKQDLLDLGFSEEYAKTHCTKKYR